MTRLTIWTTTDELCTVESCQTELNYSWGHDYNHCRDPGRMALTVRVLRGSTEIFHFSLCKNRRGNINKFYVHGDVVFIGDGVANK